MEKKDEMSDTDKWKKRMKEQFEFELRIANAQSKYLTHQKKSYLLASNTDSVQQLIENQINELTNILIEKKSEYDKITRESKIKVQQTELLEKKIKAIQEIDIKIKKEQIENEGTIETMESVLKIKDSRKQDEAYNQQTLLKQIDKLKQDIILINKESYDYEAIYYQLSNKIEKAKFYSNQILQNRNNIYSKITEQDMKNKYEKDEQELLIEYYETIIKQKYMFIQSADERKEKQRQIQEKAKNESFDKEEVEKRHELQLSMLYNKYLRIKMDELVKKYKKLEKVADKIRDICGSDDVNIMVDTLLNKNKRYNLACEKIELNEQKRKVLKKELKKLNKKLEKMKTQVLIETENHDNQKEVKPIEDKLEDVDKISLVKKELELNKKLFETGERLNFVHLSYRKVIDNINHLKSYHDSHSIKEIEEDKKKKEEDKKKNEEDKKKNEEYKNDTVDLIEEKEKNDENDGKAKVNSKGKNEEYKNHNVDLTIEKENNESENAGLEKVKSEKNDESENTEKEKENDGTEKENKEEENENDGKIKLTIEEEKFISDYKNFLKESSKTIDILFLMHSKSKFLEIMKKKGEEQKKLSNQKRNTYAKSARVIRKVTKRTTNRSILSSLSRRKEPVRRFSIRQKEIESSKKKTIDDDLISKDEDKDIMKRFIEENKRERANFLKVRSWVKK